MHGSTSIAQRPAPLAVGLVVWSLGIGGCLLLDDPRLRFPAFLLGQLLGWTGVLIVGRSRPGRRALPILITFGVLARLAAWAQTPAFSEDVFRHVYEGRLTLQEGPLFPYLHPPAELPDLDLSPQLRDEAWLRINHPELATLYPLGTQLGSAAAVGLADGLGLAPDRGVAASLVLADVGALLALAAWAPGGVLLWALAPTPIFEGAREGHVDGWVAFALLAALFGFARGRPRWGWSALAWAAGTKLSGLALAPLAFVQDRRGALRFGLLTGVLVAPIGLSILAGEASGLGAYATRWQAGGGAFGLLHLASQAVLGGDWARVLGFTLTAAGLARVLTAGLLLAALGRMLTRPQPRLPVHGGLLLLLLLLLSPTLHPWYTLWLLPFVAFGPFPGRRAALWLVASSALLHHPGYLELLEGVWRSDPRISACVHLPAWALLLIDRPWRDEFPSGSA